MNYDFSVAIKDNIERTFTYAHARNAYQYSGSIHEYNPIVYFFRLLEISPFDAFMELDGFAFKKTKNTLDKYEIPYTEEQERRAKVYYEVTEKMNRERSDYVSLYVEDLDRTGIVMYKEPFVLTTQKTINVANDIDNVLQRRKTFNVVFEKELPSTLRDSKEQLDAVKMCLTNHISCLIGGAGTGKSYVTAAIINQLMLNDKRVSILAPTHKAKEALQSKLTKGQVRTIHSFVHKPDECDVIVIDESGMLSTPLFHSLMKSYKGQQIIFVGDKNQIPPIEYGRPFERIMERFPISELHDNKRSDSSDIIALGREILGVPQNSNMAHDNIILVDTVKEAFEQGAEVLLTFMNNDVKAVNEEQKLKAAQPSICPMFSIGDKIIAKTNQTNRFYNGQLFDITSYDTIRNKTTGEVIKLKSYKDLAYNFDLAYGLTIHKSQGSEWDVVAYQPSAYDTQNLAYVAVTRAKKKLIIVGGLQDEYLSAPEWKHVI